MYDGSGATPPRQAHVAVRLRETAFNAICSQLQEKDETLYVAFQQHIKFEASALTSSYASLSCVCPKQGPDWSDACVPLPCAAAPVCCPRKLQSGTAAQPRMCRHTACLVSSLRSPRKACCSSSTAVACCCATSSGCLPCSTPQS